MGICPWEFWELLGKRWWISGIYNENSLWFSYGAPNSKWQVRPFHLLARLDHHWDWYKMSGVRGWMVGSGIILGKKQSQKISRHDMDTWYVHQNCVSPNLQDEETLDLCGHFCLKFSSRATTWNEILVSNIHQVHLILFHLNRNRLLQESRSTVELFEKKTGGLHGQSSQLCQKNF